MSARTTHRVGALLEYYGTASMTPDELSAFELRITFSYLPGTRHTHPGGHWNSHIGTWDPPDDEEIEFLFAERLDGKTWVRLSDNDSLIPWCRSYLDRADVMDAADLEDVR